MSGHYVALRLRAPLCNWPVELGRYVLKSGWVTAYTYGMEFISKGGVKI